MNLSPIMTVICTLILLLVAGGSTSIVNNPDRVVSSCDHIYKYSECTDNYQSLAAIGDEDMKLVCDIVEGRFQTDVPCPTMDRVGTCHDTETAKLDQYYSVGENPFTLESAQASCARNNGTWMP